MGKIRKEIVTSFETSEGKVIVVDRKSELVDSGIKVKKIPARVRFLVSRITYRQ